jgi:hypothetical protein
MNDWAPPRYPVHIVRPAGRFPSVKYQVFADWVAGVFSAYDHDTGTLVALSISMDGYSTITGFSHLSFEDIPPADLIHRRTDGAEWATAVESKQKTK